MKNAQMLTVFTALSLAALMCGCDIESAESSQNEVGINVEGYYANGSTPLVRQNTGASIANMNLSQNGDGLEGVDNNGNIFKGTIGQVTEGTSASFNLTGMTTAGNEGTISGNFEVSGTQSKMSGTWIEDALYSTVYGIATVPSNRIDDVDDGDTNDTVVATLKLSFTLTTIASNGTKEITASGGVSPYDWDVRFNYGIITSVNSDGSKIEYTASTGGVTNFVTATSDDGQSATAEIRQNP